MLKKLLKYDMRPMIKLWKVLLIVIPVLAITSAFAIRLMISADYTSEDMLLNTMFSIIGIGYVEIAIFAILASGIVNMVFIAMRTAKNFYSDQGQLTFTLPVSRDDLFLSKFLNSLIWNGASSLSLLFVVLVYMLLIPVPESGLISTAAFEAFGFLLDMLFEAGGARFIYTAICIVVIILELLLVSVNLLNYSVIKCQSAGGIGMCVGIYAGVCFAAAMALMLGAEGMLILQENVSDLAYDAVMILLQLVVIILLGAFDFYLFFAARDKVRYDLNLS